MGWGPGERRRLWRGRVAPPIQARVAVAAVPPERCYTPED
uniref:Uncharacterized protein n=1 Tax=Arundo donax TaxID=35708 RepID=A0A0A9BUQ1_ARUDO